MLTPDQLWKLLTESWARKIDKKNNGEKYYEFTVNTIFLENVLLLRFQELQNILGGANCIFWIVVLSSSCLLALIELIIVKKTSNENNNVKSLPKKC